jgi:hypothetical protein
MEGMRDGRSRPIASDPGAAAQSLVTNLTLILILVSGIGVWVLVYTDIPLSGQFLGLGGIVSYIAFVVKMLTDDVAKQLQHGFVQVLGEKAVRNGLIIVMLLLACFSLFFGAIRVQALPSSQISAFDLYSEGSSDPNPQTLGKDGSSNVIVFTPFGHSRWRLKVPGYPYQPVDVYPLERPSKYLPEAQKPRRVLLVVPSEQILTRHNTEKLKLVIDAGEGKRLTVPDYTWFAFWVGCSGDVKVPAAVQTDLRIKFPKGKYAALDLSLDTPLSDPSWLGTSAKDFDLEFPVKKVTVTLEDEIGAERLKRTFDVRNFGATFVQLEYLANDDWKKD